MKESRADEFHHVQIQCYQSLAKINKVPVYQRDDITGVERLHKAECPSLNGSEQPIPQYCPTGVQW